MTDSDTLSDKRPVASAQLRLWDGLQLVLFEQTSDVWSGMSRRACDATTGRQQSPVA